MQKDLYADLYVKIQNVIALFSYIYTLFIFLYLYFIYFITYKTYKRNRNIKR